MRTTIYATLLLGLVASCGGGTTTMTTPNMPALGTQIDRMCRAGVNTALTDPFDIAQGMTEDQVKNAYNADANVAAWTTTWAPMIATNLAILDSLDGTCGNQLLACGMPGGCPAGAMAMAGRYNTLAAVLADDQLYVNTASGTCTTYLAVEANAVGVSNTDCGGRTPLYDTIQVTYSALATGKFSGITSGITADADGQASLTAFPFLSNPN